MTRHLWWFLLVFGCAHQTAGSRAPLAVTPCTAQGSGATDLPASERAVDDKLMARAGRPDTNAARPVYEPHQEPIAKTDAEVTAAVREPVLPEVQPCPRIGDSK